MSGDFKTALTLQDQLMPLHNVMFVEPSPAPVKYAASKLGICAPDVRLPMIEASPALHQKIDEAINSLGLQKIS